MHRATSYWGLLLGLACGLGVRLAEAQPAPAPAATESPRPEQASAPTPAPAAEPSGLDAPAPCAGCCDCDSIFKRSSLGFALGVGISYLGDLDGLNSRLSHAGYGELPHFVPYLSLSVPVSLRHLMALIQVQIANSSSDASDSALSTVHAALSFGYSITSPERLAIYPYAGIGIGTANLSVGQPGPLAPSFDRTLTDTKGALDLSTMAFMGTAGMAAELLLARVDDHPTRGFFAAARIGVQAVLAATAWSRGSSLGSLGDGPRAPLGGLFGELAAGLRL